MAKMFAIWYGDGQHLTTREDEGYLELDFPLVALVDLQKVRTVSQLIAMASTLFNSDRGEWSENK